jgi:hypothetical protein
MKPNLALLATVFAAGVLASIALAGNPHHSDSTTGTTGTTTTGTTTTSSHAGKVLVCHKLGNGHYVLVSVSARSAPAKGKHGGDVLASGGTCPGPIQGHGGSTTTETTTTNP